MNPFCFRRLPQSKLKYRVELVNSNKQSHVIYTEVLNGIQSNLHDFVSSAHSSIVQSLISRTKRHVDLDGIDFDHLSEKRKIIQLFDAVIAQGKLDACREAPRNFLEIIINFDFKSSLAKDIRTKINEEFSDKVKIITEEKLLSPHKTSQKRFCYLNCFLFFMATLLIAFSIALLVNGESTNFQNVPEQDNFTSSSSPELNLTTLGSIPRNQTISPGVLLDSPERRLPGDTIAEVDDAETATTTSTSTKNMTVNHQSNQPTKRSTFKIKVNSHSVYEDIMPFAPANREIVAGIFVEDPTNWPCRANLTDGDRLERLYIGGNIYSVCLLNAFTQTPNVTFLQLSNRFGKLCQWNEGTGASILSGENAPVYLNQTTRLIMERFMSSCVEVYLAVAEKIKTPNLIGFAIEKGIIDDRNIVLVQRILKNNWKTLTHLRFQWTRMTSSIPFFGSEMNGVLRNVEHFQVDFISDYVGWGFCNALPNMKHLVSGRGYLQEEQLFKLKDCKSMETLKTSLKLSQSTTFDATILRSGFNNVTSIELKLCHESCEDPSNMNILYLRGFNTLRDNLWNMEVLSKCRLVIDPEPEQQLNNPCRQELRSTRGGYFVFSYNLKTDFR